MKTALAMVTAAGMAANANAQLLVGNDDTAGPNAWNVNVGDETATILWEGFEVWGMAYDGATNTVYANDGTTLGFGALGGAFPDGTVGITDAAGAALSMVSLAWANGGLYSTRNIANEAVYQIDPNTGVAEVVLDYTDADYDFGGLAFNPDDGLFYGTSDDTSPASGLYSIDVFGGGAINLITPYPDGETDIDGLAVGNGIAYLVEDEAGETIHPFDLANGVYLDSLMSPMTSSEVFSGAAWVPAPTTMALLGLGGLVATRRRR